MIPNSEFRILCIIYKLKIFRNSEKYENILIKYSILYSIYSIYSISDYFFCVTNLMVRYSSDGFDGSLKRHLGAIKSVIPHMYNVIFFLLENSNYSLSIDN